MAEPAPRALTARELVDLYNLLDESPRRTFLAMLGGQLTAETVFGVCAQLSKPELSRFSEMMFDSSWHHFFPILLEQAVQIAKDRPELSKDEMFDELAKVSREQIESNTNVMIELDREKVKEHRDRKSDPEIIRRNVVICNNRRDDPKRWSQGKLAKHFGIDERTIRKILGEADKWRQLAARLKEDE